MNQYQIRLKSEHSFFWWKKKWWEVWFSKFSGALSSPCLKLLLLVFFETTSAAVVYFNNILRAAFALISFQNDITNPNSKHIKAAKNTFAARKMLVKLTPSPRLWDDFNCCYCTHNNAISNVRLHNSLQLRTTGRKNKAVCREHSLLYK